MKENIKKYSVLILTLILAFTVVLSGCSKSSDEDLPDEGVISEDEMELVEDLDEEDYDNGISFEEEAEGADLHFKAVPVEDFFGSWSATSGQAMYMYGNVDLDIKANGTWTGNIAEEDLSGKWEADKDHLNMTSDLINFTLSFTDGGKLIMQEDREEDGELLNTVLTKK